MPSRKHTVALRTTAPSTEDSVHTVLVRAVPSNQQNAARYAHLQAVPFHDAAELAGGIEADCFLQLWELDHFQTDRFLTNEESDTHPAENQLIATFPGVLVRSPNGSVEFRPTGAPQPTRILDDRIGSVKLSLRAVGETAAAEYQLPLPEYEGVLELAPTLRTAADDTSFGAQQQIPPYQVKNVRASAAQQVLHRGGITVAFCANYRAAGSSDPPADSNEAEFERQAEDMIDVLPSFKVNDAGTLGFGFHLIEHPDEIAALLEQTRTAVRDAIQDVLDLHGIEDVLVSTLPLYCHGIRTALKLNEYSKLRIQHIPAFVDAIRPHVSRELVVPIFACNAGRGPGSLTGNNGHGDNSYGRTAVSEELGHDSFGWHLLHELRRKGIDHATVWAHTTAAHTTRNSFLRVLSAWGTADLFNVLYTHPFPSYTVFTNNYRGQVFVHSGSQPVALFKQRLHNANLLRKISLASGMYLPWEWRGGPKIPIPALAFDAETEQQTQAILAEIRGLLPEATLDADILQYEDATQQFVIGLWAGATDFQLTEHFRFRDFPADGGTPRIKMQLIRYLEVLRRRFNRGITISRVVEQGEGLLILPSPNNPANYNRLLEAANQMVTEGLFDEANEVTAPPLRTHIGVYHRR